MNYIHTQTQKIGTIKMLLFYDKKVMDLNCGNILITKQELRYVR